MQAVQGAKGEVGLVDLLLIIASNLRLLLLGPLLAGGIALVVAYTLPQSFTSRAILSLPVAPVAAGGALITPTPTPAQAAAIMVSPVVLDPVIRNLKLAEGPSIEEDRARLAAQIKATVGKDSLLRLDVTAGSPAEAQDLCKAVIDAWLQTTVPGDQDREDLQKRLTYAKASLDSVSRLLGQLTLDGAASSSKPLTRGEAVTSLLSVGELQAKYLSEVLSVPRAMQGLSHDVVIQPPTLPAKAVAPKKAAMVMIVVCTTGLLLLVFVFVRHGLRLASQVPEAAEKMSRLRSAFFRSLGLA